MELNQRIIQSEKNSFQFTNFQHLMENRIYKVLIICSSYDFYMLEEDGRIDELIFNEYVALNLRYPPVFLHADNFPKSLRILQEDKIDLIITMLSLGSSDVFQFSKAIKDDFPAIPIVVLTQFSREVSMQIQKEDLSAIDYVFAWQGDTKIMLSIIKLIEDKMNAEQDVSEENVQVILLVENSIRFYSSYLPLIYNIVLKQSRKFMKEGLNDHREMIRMRGRPKILLATNYEEAIDLFNKYKDNCLGVISDVAYDKNGVKNKQAGIELTREIKKADKHMPVLLQSSDKLKKEIAEELNISFIYKYSKNLTIKLRDYITKSLAFGSFIFRMPDYSEIGKAANLRELQDMIEKIPDQSLQYHFDHDDFSRWLNARALFPLAKKFKNQKLTSYTNIEDARKSILKTISSFRIHKSKGIIAKFDKETYDSYLSYARIGDGALGGKARGLSFIDAFIKKHQLCCKFPNTLLKIPRTVVLSTEVFDEFMEQNDLFEIALSEANDDDIMNAFVNAKIPANFRQDLRAFLIKVNHPLAVRSSSVMEDSHYQPFAGIYSTYMIPRTTDLEQSLGLLCTAIKSVYASVYFADSKSYMEATSNMIDSEKMGVVLQEVCGSQYGDRFYPTFSGVARSINFYPIPPEKPSDGIASIALGLGKYIVDGGMGLRFSPKYPQKVLQLSTPQMALAESQKKFFALNLDPKAFQTSIKDDVNLFNLRIKDAEKDGSITHIASTYDFQNGILQDGAHYEGKKVITFANILKYDFFPLAKILQNLLKIGRREMNSPIEIEFAVNLSKNKKDAHIFNLLQIRPIVDNSQALTEPLDLIKEEDTIIRSNMALGNGIVEGIHDLVYVRTENFNAANTPEIAKCVAKRNESFVKADINYILIGPGRWGSSDPWLGIPIKWPHISAARLIIESGLENYRIDPSQGTHFFQNLTSLRVGYFTINPYSNDGFYDYDYLASLPAVYEDEYIRHVRFDNSLTIKIDGRKNMGVVLKAIKTEIE